MNSSIIDFSSIKSFLALILCPSLKRTFSSAARDKIKRRRINMMLLYIKQNNGPNQRLYLHIYKYIILHGKVIEDKTLFKKGDICNEILKRNELQENQTRLDSKYIYKQIMKI